MWPELLPFMGLMGVVLCGGPAFSLAMNLYFRDHYTPRNRCRYFQDYLGFKRDEYLTGSIYKPVGLEAIPDEE